MAAKSIPTHPHPLKNLVFGDTLDFFCGEVEF